MDDLTRLALEAGRGNRGALDDFVAAAYDPVRRLCALLVDEHGADDLAQETFIRAMKALRGFRGDASARTWLLAIARNTCADELRARTRRRRRQRQMIDNEAVALSAVPDAEEQVGILDLISQLTPDRREAFMLTQVLHLSYEEAAAICGCPAGTIHSRVARARNELVTMYTGVGRNAQDQTRSGSDLT